MNMKELNIDKRKTSLFLTEEARRIIDRKVKEWGVSKVGVVELSLRELDKKDSVT